MPLHPSAGPAALLFVIAALLGGCTSGADDPGPGKPPPAPDPLAPQWSRSLSGVDPASLGTVYRRGDRILNVVGDVVAGLDSATGKRAWQRRIPGTCTVSEPNAAGDLAVSLGKGCRDVAVLDADTGKTRWREHLPSVSPGYDSGNVVASIGDRTVTVVQFCGQVTRLSLRDGHRLGILAPHDRACANEADSDGQLIALWHDPETVDTPDDHGTGWIPPWDGDAAFELYDADSGKRLWRRQADRRGGGLYPGAVVGSDPAILALKEDDHTTMRRYGKASADPGAFVGRQLESGGGTFTPVGVADGVMVGSYSSAYSESGNTRLFAYDLASGRELWSRSYASNVATLQVAGVDGDGVAFTEQISDTDADGDSQTQAWVTRWDLHNGSDTGTVGWIDAADSGSVWTLVDGLLLSSGKTVAAFELPPADPDLSPPREDVDWSEDDIRSDQRADPCAAVRPETLRGLGLQHSSKLPVPADCHWSETAEPDYSERDLRVSVSISEPSAVAGFEESAPPSAVENAKAAVKTELRSFEPPTSGSLADLEIPEPEPLRGFGDEAYATTGGRLAGPSSGSYLLVRERNVVVEVQAAGSYDVPYRGSAPPSPGRSEAGVLAAARDVLSALELGVEVPTAASPTGRDTVRSICDVLDDDAEALGLSARTPLMRPGSDPRSAACAWWQNAGGDGELTAQVYAASESPLTGRTGVEVAEDLYEDSGDGRSKPLRGLGEVAMVYGDDAGYTDRTVLIRRGNVVVAVSYSREIGGVGDQVERDAVRMARELLHTTGP